MKKRVFNSSIFKNGLKNGVRLGLLGGAVVLAGCGTSPAPVTEKPAVVTGVPLGTVATESIESTFEVAGVVRPRISTVISSKVVGTITAMRVREGDRVRVGQVLVEIENRDARAQLEKAQAGLREAQSATEELDRNLKAAVAAKTAAEAGRRLAEATLKRYQGLRERQSVSAQEFDEVEARAQVAGAEVERADKMRQVIEARRQMVEARIDQAKADLAGAQAFVGYARITAPVEGVVVTKSAEVGGLAAPGAPLLTIEGGGSGGGLRLEAAVEESRIGGVATGAAARVRIESIGGEELPGRVVEIVPAADPASRTFTVRIDLPVNPALRSGQYGKALFAAGQRSALLVPGKALVRRGQLTGVYVVDEKGVARLRLVTLGRPVSDQTGDQTGVRYEILSGLNDGETVVMESARLEREGVQVK